MYGMKLARPITPSSEYVAPISFFAKMGSIGLCIPYDVPIIKATAKINHNVLFIIFRGKTESI